MFCKECGKEIEEKSKFCNFCGAKCVEEIVEDVKVKEAEGNTENKKKIEEILNQLNNEGTSGEKVIDKNNKKRILPIMVFAFILLVIIVILVNVNSGVNLKKVYKEATKSMPDYGVFSKCADDGSYIRIDTNPSDEDEYVNYSAMTLIQEVNEILEVPESVEVRIGQTRSMDGIQRYDAEEFTMSWTYHPDNGLEILYEKK